MDETGGYAERTVDEIVHATIFSGNAHTHPRDAKDLSIFRAVEICKEKGFRLARIFHVENRSSKKTVRRSSTYNYSAPTQFQGTGNSYGTYGGFGNARQSSANSNFYGTVYGGDQFGQTDSWDETYHYPVFETFFACADHAYLLGVAIKPISPEDMKPFVKDLMGSVQVESFSKESLNKEVFQVGDFITKIAGTRVTNIVQMTAAIDNSPNKESIPVMVIRDGKERRLIAKALESIDNLEAVQRREVSSVCQRFSEIRQRSICSSSIDLSP